jgi:hypothetical protein
MASNSKGVDMKYLLALLMMLLPAVVEAQTCVQADLNHPLSVAVNWVDQSNNEAGFILERSLNGGAFAVIAPSLPANTTATTDTTVVRSTIPNTYTYRMKAYAGTTQSVYSNTACITFAPLAPPPPVVNPPGGLTVAAISSSSFRITWEDIQNEVGYELEGKTAKGNASFTQIASLPADSTTYDWTGRKRFTSYCVRMRGLLTAISSVAATAYTPTICATTSK